MTRDLQYGVEPRPAKGQAHHDMARHGILVTNRPLTVEDLRSFELAPLVDVPMLGNLAERICRDGMSEYASEYIELHQDQPESFCRNVASRARRPDPGVLYSVCSYEELGRVVLDALRRAGPGSQVPGLAFCPRARRKIRLYAKFTSNQGGSSGPDGCKPAPRLEKPASSTTTKRRAQRCTCSSGITSRLRGGSSLLIR